MNSHNQMFASTMSHHVNLCCTTHRASHLNGPSSVCGIIWIYGQPFIRKFCCTEYEGARFHLCVTQNNLLVVQHLLHGLQRPVILSFFENLPTLSADLKLLHRWPNKLHLFVSFIPNGAHLACRGWLTWMHNLQVGRCIWDWLSSPSCFSLCHYLCIYPSSISRNIVKLLFPLQKQRFELCSVGCFMVFIE